MFSTFVVLVLVQEMYHVQILASEKKINYFDCFVKVVAIIAESLWSSCYRHS